MLIRTRPIRRSASAGVALAMLGGSGVAPAASVGTAFNGGTTEGWSLIGLPSPVTGGTWKTIGGPYPLTLATTGGSDGGGYISGTDTTPDALYFSAPPVFLGNKSAFLDGTLSFAIRNTPGDPVTAVTPNDAPLILVSNSGKALYQTVAPTTVVATSFVTLSYKLGTASNWRVNGKTGTDATAQDFADVLGDLGAAYILGDYRAGNGETTSIDDVQMNSPFNAAPEPGTAALVMLSTSVTLGRRRRLTRPSRAWPRDAAKS